MKKNPFVLALSTLTVISFFIFIFPELRAVASHQFPDVSTSHRNHAAIDFLVTSGAVQGYPDGTFKPNQSINRVETLKILFAGNGLVIAPDLPTTETAGFSDVPGGQWYIGYLFYAKMNGFVQGYPDGTFHPTDQVKLGEALKMLFKVFLIEVPEVDEDTDLPNDVRASDWFAKYVALAIQKNIIKEDSNGNVKPGLGLSRGAVAEIEYRLKYSAENGLEVFVPPAISEPPSSGGGQTGQTEERGFSGIISRVSADSQNFLLGTSEAVGNWGFVTIQTSNQTQYEVESKIEETPTFASLQAGGKVTAMGTYNASTKILTASTITVFSYVSVQEGEVLNIAIDDNVFSPTSLNAYLFPSNNIKVRFTNLSSTPHQIATDPHPTHTQVPGFVSDILNQGDSYEFTFTGEGTFTYHCHLHPNMKGTITLEIPRG